MSEGVNHDQGNYAAGGKWLVSPVIDILLSRRLRPLLILSLYSFLIFPVFRVALFLVSREAVQNTTVWEIGVCFGYGFQFDAVVVGYTMLPMVLALGLVPAASFFNKIFRRTVTIYATIVMALLLVLEIVNAVFFVNFRRRLNWASLNYPRHPRETAMFVWETYNFWLILLVPALGLGVYVVYRLLRRHCWQGRLTANSPASRLSLTAVMAVLCIIACRPTFGRFPLRPGSETHSANNFVNEASTNTLFSLWHAGKSIFEDGQDEGKFYDLPPVNEAHEVVRGLLFQDGDQIAPIPGRPLRRRVATGREMRDLNIVVIIMEGQSNEPVGALGHGWTQTPELDEICRGGMFFEQLYATGARTSRGLTGVLVGHPDLGGITLLEREEALGKFQTLPGVFASRGYRTMFITGGDPDYDNMKDFLAAGGTETIIGQKEIGPKHAGAWGVPDEMIFRKAHQMFMSMGDEKFFAAILTVSNHQPYTVPQGRTPMLPADSEENKMLNAYRYADWALGDFFREARQADYFQDTLFVIVSDHGHGEYLELSRAIDVPGYRLPCVFYAPGIVSPRRISTVASQTDIAPTLLGMLGGTYEHSFLGRDILRVAPGDGFALLHEDRHIAFVRAGRAIVTGPINRRRKPRTVPEMFDVTMFDMYPVAPGQLDVNDTANIRRDMLSLYTVALQQYLTIKKEGNQH
ncbi:MAG: sulfatase-like hydrolase/transferase [Phycisphaerae bacterium]|nr:sulfatase-like hydrolase/transferase [Phycisphaerae bacterium]